jgi:hypothetical protein
MFEGVNVKVKKEINMMKDRGKVEILRTRKKEDKMFSDESSSSSSVSDNNSNSGERECNNDNDNNVQILPKRRINKTEIIETKHNDNNTHNVNNNATTYIQTQYNNLNNTNINNNDDDYYDDNDDNDEYKPTIENIALTNYNKLQSQRETTLYKKYINTSSSESNSNSDSEKTKSPQSKPLTTHKAKFIPQTIPHQPSTSPSPSPSTLDTFTYLLQQTQPKPNDTSTSSYLPSYELIDDTDDLNDITEYEKWKIRELTRIKRSLQETQTKLTADLELQHRRTLTDDQVKSENLKLGSNDTLRKFKSKLNYLQKYYHKGAFFQDESQLNDEHIYNRDYNLPTWEDSIDRTKLPSIMNKRRGNLFKKGQSKYTHLSNEDTTNFDAMFKVPEHIAKGLLKKTGGYK